MNAHAAAIEAFIKETTRRFGAPPASVVLRQGKTEMTYDNTNKGTLFRNDDKEREERDYSGSINVEGTEYWISGYVRTSKSGKKYLSLSVKPKQEKPAASKASRADEFDDSVPF